MVHELLAAGHGTRTIARYLGRGRHTVQRYARAVICQALVDRRWQAPRPSMPDPFKPRLRQRMDEGCGNVAQLFREISSLGYAGSYSTVRDYLDQHRPGKTPLPPPPTVRQVTGWLTRHPGTLIEDEQPQLKALLERCPELHAASSHIRAFATMLTQLTGQNLPQWISDARVAELPGISSFAKGLEQDLGAITQGLTSRWSSGPVEGRVNHIKMIKRQTFGRARLPLLRKRLLIPAQNQ
ncbi:MAG TPA: transposase [Streptosporangiaceae bacterium]